MKKMHFSLLILLFVMVCSVDGFSQNYTTRKTAKGKVKEAYKKAMDYNRKNKNKEAIKEFERVLKMDPTFIDAHIHWSALHYEIKEYEKAELGFERALQIDPNYKRKVYYTLGLTELLLEKHLEAAEHFDNFLAVESKNKTLIRKARYYKKCAILIDNALNNPVPFDPQSLGPNINSADHGEYLPSITADGNTLVYTKNILSYNEDFFISHKQADGTWGPGEPIRSLNTELSEGAQSVSADGKFIVFTDCGGRRGYGKCDLFFSEVKNGKWTEAKNIGRPINSQHWEAMPSISASGQALYFSSSRPGGKGMVDIWVSYRQADGSWGEPENLGDKINTPYIDQSPFIHPDGQTLYFMSEGHPRMGGFDLYYSRKQADGTWGEAVNLGYPINTAGDEGAMIVSLDGKTAYFAFRENQKEVPRLLLDSDRKLAEIGNHDLYQFELYPEARPQPVTYVRAEVFDANTRERLEAFVEFVDLGTSNTHVSSQTDSEGEFLVCLPLGKNYALNVSKEKYLFHSENFALEQDLDHTEPYALKIYLQPIPELLADGSKLDIPTDSKPIILRNVFFETAKADLLPASISELTRLKELLESNPQLHIQINGHTDNVGTDADNFKLSDARAKAVYNYLIENGIEAARLRYKGYGESEPIDTNDTEEGRQNNRRTEFVIIN